MQQRTFSLVLAVSLLIVGVLSACGQKGPLTLLPTPKAAPPAPAASTPAPTASSAR